MSQSQDTAVPVFSLFFSLVLASAAVGQEPALDTKKKAVVGGGVTVHVMSFNIRYGTAKDKNNSWPRRRDLVFDVIRRHAPDVVGLQEALRFQIDEIRAALPQYGEFGVGRDDGKAKGEYAAILYAKDRFSPADGETFWLSDTPTVVASTSWGNEIPRICTWVRLVEKSSGRAFTVYNVHLDHQSRTSRQRSVELVAQSILDRRPRVPFVLMGDFNAPEQSSVIRYLKGEVPRASEDKDRPVAASPRLVDTFRVLHPDVKNAGTFNGWRKQAGERKIDYVLAPGSVQVIEASILRDQKDGRWPSDHFPVTAKLRLPAAPQANGGNGKAR